MHPGNVSLGVEFVNEFHQKGIIVSGQFDDPKATFHLRETNL
jgi:hypothetical protein